MKLFKKKQSDGSEVKVDLKAITLSISGMTCDHCAVSVENLFKKSKGISQVSVDYPTEQAQFTIDESQIGVDEIVTTINGTPKFRVSESRDDAVSGFDYDLIIIGGGSAAFSAATQASELGKTSLLINGGLPMGGTCVNIGCVPSKFLIRAAESLHRSTKSHFSGIQQATPELDFEALIQQKHELVSEMQKKKYLNVASSIEGLTLLEGWATFKDDHTVSVDDKNYTAENFLIATGSTTNIPEINGLHEVGCLTSQELFDIESLPERMTILGAGYIGLEIAMAYRRFGTKVRMLEYTDRVLRSQSEDISEEIQIHLANEGIELHPNHRISQLEKQADGSVHVTGTNSKSGEKFEFEDAGLIVIATGTRPNTQKLGLDTFGLNTDAKGFIVVNERMETNLDHVYAAGDCTSTPAFVYTAAKEAKLAILNAYSDTKLEMDYSALPWVVFTDPQIAGAGMDEAECEEMGIPYEVSIVPLTEVPKAAVALDTRGFIKLIRNPMTDELLGGRVIAAEGGEIVMQISQAIKYRISVSELADSLHPYLTLSEGIKLAAISFHKDVAELSCCAS